MDQQKLRTLVFEKTGVRIDVDDPVFALVALNEAVLEEAVERHIARIDAASANLLQQAQHHGHGHAAAEHPPGYVPTPSAGMVRPIATQTAAITPRELRLLGAAAGIALATALIVLGGQAAFHNNGLTPEQTLALQKAEKLEQAIQKLDPKTRAELEAALQK
ncbi:hypothetical protein GTP46_23775 [Duganella sp. FT135W]|uniref:Uncharacterized protein n=1 Tax=Duganella flavida TaxID=2692175 RepID=A0A6L8KF08_9BURK|nr:hypothetical protein [Duganella flavida]MYM25655.1 hypothetical protein [Duganella flavida]